MNPEIADATIIVFDPVALSAAQRVGDACVVCRKSWPRPGVVVGRLPDRHSVYACAECVHALVPALSVRARCGEPGRVR
jgi:hypothetical protein